MFLDAQNLFSNSQALTADANSTNTVDLGVGGGDSNFEIALAVTEAFNTLTSLNVTVMTDDNTSFSSAVAVVATGAIALADLTIGASFVIRIPANKTERYLRLAYDVVGSNPTTGEIDAAVVCDYQSNL